MALTPIPYRAGVIKDDAEYTAQGYASDTQWVRAVDGYFQSQGGWVQHLTQQFEGTARGKLGWQTAAGRNEIAFGTHTKLYVIPGGFIANITPSRDSGTLALNPISTTLGDATVTITDTSHGMIDGATAFLGNATATGGITLAPFGTMPAAAFSTTSGSNIVTIAWASHGLQTGWELIVSGSAAVGGITPDGTFLIRRIDDNYIQIYFGTAASSTATGGGTPNYIARRPFIITYINTNSYSIEYDSVATSTATGGGAGVQYLYEINPGREFGTFGTGFGSGGYSGGGYGSATSGAGAREAAVWCLDHYDDDLLAARIGTTIYRWQGNWSARAAVLTNAPDQVLWFLVTPNRTVMALGCTNPDGDFDPMMVRFTDSLDPTVWDQTLTNNAGEIRLGGGSRLVGGIVALDGIYAFTDNMLYQIEYVGNYEQMYVERPLGTGFGLASPLAVAALGQAVYWVTHEFSFAQYLGGTPQELPCKSKTWFKNLVSRGQEFKIFAYTDHAYNAITWGIPSDPSQEITNYIRIDIPDADKAGDGAGGWSIGEFDRTIWLDNDSDANNYPLGFSLDGYIYEQENGNSADGAAMDRYVEWAPIDAVNDNGEPAGDRVMNVNAFVIDRKITSGTLQVYAYFRRYPNADLTTKGPKDLNSNTVRISIKGQGRQMGMKFISSTNNDNWRLGIIRADMSPGSRR